MNDRRRSTLSRDNPRYNHDGLLLDLAYELDEMEQNAYSHYMRVLWELMREIREQARLTDRV